LEIGELGKPSPENPKILPDSDCLNSVEALIDHGEAQAVPRAISRVHSGPHRGIQGREPPPAAPWPSLTARSRQPLANGPRPSSFFCRPSPEAWPIQAQRPVQPSISSGRFLLRAGAPIRSDPTRLSGGFFIYREAPQLSRLDQS
ncbi:hypothetical protein CRG98_033136, partial [Punica granatum]